MLIEYVEISRSVIASKRAFDVAMPVARTALKKVENSIRHGCWLSVIDNQTPFLRRSEL